MKKVEINNTIWQNYLSDILVQGLLWLLLVFCIYIIYRIFKKYIFSK